MSRRYNSLMLIPAALCWSLGHGAEPLSKNPFTRPGYTADRPLPNAEPLRLAELEPLRLKATLIAGGRALADINGEILSPGDEIQGHRLIRIREGEAVLRKDGNLLTLSVHDDKEENSRD